MELLAELARRRVLAIIRADSADFALSSVRTLVEAGVTALEISLTTPDATEAVRTARAEFGPEVILGAGTVLTPEQADEVAAAGVGFVVTPGITRGAQRSVELGLPLLCGALTPTEVIAALDLGALAVKLFPAKLHGPGYLRELRGPLPTAPLIAVGGVDATSAPEYLAAGALAVGVGSPLLGDAGQGGSQSALAARAADFLKAVANA
ncbi:bifunctional 4-hydroxy-2-oxoglutarate aldolase/2-dehydro-3-deoxy-phosphogluconate aldolase [Kribbella deserti]|uniref:Bifunctional 4-hydroxy-2-oxoglutarate aldolase/2-dehydro-3-deoxy-phosphogluconate aldolase n=1 Tax=Kribbella deserti TaxID=1926257 RepID=A0ABV6QWI3_9ACTN